MKIFLSTFILCCVLFSCNTDRTVENTRLKWVTDAMKEAQFSTNQINVQLQHIRLNYPTSGVPRFNSFMKRLIERDTIGVFCVDQEDLDISYQVEHASKSLWCLSKTVHVKCPMGNKAFHFHETFSYYVKKDSIFQVKMMAHADFKKKLAQQLETRNMRRCSQPDFNRLEFQLKKGKYFVRVPYDFPLCDTLMPFEFRQNTVKVVDLNLIR